MACLVKCNLSIRLLHWPKEANRSSWTYDKVSHNNLLPRIQHDRVDAFLGSRSQQIVDNGIPQGTALGRLNCCCILITSQKEWTHKYACMLDTVCIVKYTLQLTTCHVNLTWTNYHQHNFLITATHWHVAGHTIETPGPRGRNAALKVFVRPMFEYANCTWEPPPLEWYNATFCRSFRRWRIIIITYTAAHQAQERHVCANVVQNSIHKTSFSQQMPAPDENTIKTYNHCQSHVRLDKHSFYVRYTLCGTPARSIQ